MWVLEQGISKYKNGCEKKWDKNTDHVKSRGCFGKWTLALSRRNPAGASIDSSLCSTTNSLRATGNIIDFFKSQFPHLQLLKTMVGSCEDQIS